MKIVVVVSFLLISIVSLCSGFSQPIIPDTKADGCIGDICGPLCAWEDVKIFPGSSLDNFGKCQKLACTTEFNILITPCPFDITGEYEWTGGDVSKPYPDCCGEKTKRN